MRPSSTGRERGVGEGSGTVAEAVEPDRREVDLLVQLDEPPCDIGQSQPEDHGGLLPGSELPQSYDASGYAFDVCTSYL